MLEIISAGMLTTIQDGGRRGFQKFGVPVSGAMDLYALAVANILVDNEQTEAALEMTLVGCTAKFTQSAVFAVCGGDFDLTLGGAPIEMSRAYRANVGDILAIGGAKSGCRAYLAVQGGFEIEPVLESGSTYLKGGFGGNFGRALKAGDCLKLRGTDAPISDLTNRFAPIWRLPPVKNLRVVLGPQDDLFSERGIATFLGENYKISPASDRMGYRLEGEQIEFAPEQDGNIISDGVTMGSIQVPAGKPLIMMADRQTTGGYAKIATVISADLPICAQCKPGDTVKFELVTMQQAQALLRRRKRELNDLVF